ncbi:LysR family transcriptional regulator [Sphingopyxis sp. PAMC25046]|uniref:LysR family transcriptional regulator n=1 Tax=Sphingopyxis sp. PAMC25046 TaxID=2565556 RepID=UPI00109DE08B|nr:LysR family transcriptional regulator [Sphingopyxis sp. PAMC25046]QCB53943.1 LysR family transcriptional regulator [Sphingopyxis sp. PAMC25046]
MRREEMADLATFVTVAEEQSFTKAAAKLGLSQSAVSQVVRRLEERLGLRLLSRTTRSVAPTEVGERILATLSPMLRDLDASIEALSEYRDKPAGNIRITTVEHAAVTILRPALARMLPGHPDINVEVIIDYGLTDIVAERFDAGVRLGGQVDKDMIAVRIGPDIPMAVVASPDYFEHHAAPSEPGELVRHQCINLRLPTSGTNNRWNFRQRGKMLRVQVEGQLVFNAIAQIRDAALDGLGLAYLPLDYVADAIESGSLIRILERWTEDLPGYHLYYPNRRFASPAFKLLVETLRFRQP